MNFKHEFNCYLMLDTSVLCQYNTDVSLRHVRMTQMNGEFIVDEARKSIRKKVEESSEQILHV